VKIRLNKVRTELGSARNIGPSVLRKFARKRRQKIKFRSILVVLFIKKLEGTFRARIPNESRVFRPKRPWRREPLCSTKTVYFAPILCMWSNHDMIQPRAKYSRRERARSRSEKRKLHLTIWGDRRHLRVPQMAKMSASSHSFQAILCMWSDHGMIRPHAKYRRHKRAISRSEKQKTFDYFVRSQAAGGAQNGQNVARNLMVSINTLHVVGS
jgi:hypothetical protein